ncbi:MAG: hypothetical protein M3T49_04395 [Candidatus Eremiobacteraeota bacterium]|nr:hypothetical protein [Candidatus Eremiobacteraeota bacterium]
MPSSADGNQGLGQAAQSAIGQVQDKAQQVAGQAKGFFRSQVDQRSNDFGGQLSTTAEDIRSVSGQLRERGRDSAAKLIDGLADRTSQVGDYLKDSDTDRMMQDLERFARRQPWAMAAAGLVLGLAASRLMKASSSQRYQSSWSGSTDGYDYGDYGSTRSGYSGVSQYQSRPEYQDDDTERYSE